MYGGGSNIKVVVRCVPLGQSCAEPCMPFSPLSTLGPAQQSSSNRIHAYYPIKNSHPTQMSADERAGYVRYHSR